MTADGTPTTSAAIEPWADHAATVGRASRNRMIATWTIHVPGEYTSGQEAAYEPQPVDPSIAAAANTPSGGQPRIATRRRPIGVVGWRSSGPRNPASPAGCSIHEPRPRGGRPPDDGAVEAGLAAEDGPAVEAG